MLELRNPGELLKRYERVVSEAQPVKGVVRGGSDLKKLDEAGTTYEFVITYVYKPGRFAKEMTVVAVVPVKRLVNGVFTCDFSSAIVRVLSYRKGNLEEEWSGSLEEAKGRVLEVASAIEADAEALAASPSS